MYRMKGFQSSIPSVWTFLVLADADYDKVRIPPVLDDLSAHKGSCTAT